MTLMQLIHADSIAGLSQEPKAKSYLPFANCCLLRTVIRIDVHILIRHVAGEKFQVALAQA